MVYCAYFLTTDSVTKSVQTLIEIAYLCRGFLAKKHRIHILTTSNAVENTEGISGEYGQIELISWLSKC